ncbi:MAG: excinuclease ABC subunit C [Chlorobi bacterium]|nr:excinuclease ABC subunit C [Chlorobiota bacterium]
MNAEKQEATLDTQRKNLPDSPGVYLFYNREGQVIYVGKAKNLRKRVASYFNKNISGKTRVLVKKTVALKHIVVDTESDALLLENNLIKKYQPRYNILLKDDKSYPWICIKKEAFPRVFLTRNIVKDGSEYYGPYASAFMVRTLLNLIRKLYPLRTCKYNLSEQNIRAGKFKPCLEYHLGSCKAPCIGKQTSEDYENALSGVRQIMRGNIREVIKQLKDEMEKYATQYQYEKAQLIKEKLEVIETYRSKTVIVNPSLTNTDVFSYIEKGNLTVINYLNIIKGAIVQSHSVEVKKVLDETREDILLLVISEFRLRFNSKARQTIIPFRISEVLTGTKWIVPTRGDKKKLLDLSERNARLYLLEKEKKAINISGKRDTWKKLEILQKDLRLKKIPVHIECFDNSNLLGTNPVAACVVFKNGKPARKEYRHFHIKTVTGPDDFASMEEIVIRRYKRLLQEKAGLPQLIVIDGGKGQLNAALKALEELNLQKKIAVVGIAKRLEEIYFPHDPVPMYLDKTGISLKMIQRIRDEAHRFGITFHRNMRSKQFINLSLNDIPGIGRITIRELMKKYKSVENLKRVEIKELEKLIGKSKTKKLLKYLANNPPDNEAEEKD